MKKSLKIGTRVEITTGTYKGRRGTVIDAFGAITWVRIDGDKSYQIGKGSLKRIEAAKCPS